MSAVQSLKAALSKPGAKTASLSAEVEPSARSANVHLKAAAASALAALHFSRVHGARSTKRTCCTAALRSSGIHGRGRETAKQPTAGSFVVSKCAPRSKAHAFKRECSRLFVGGNLGI